MTEAPAPPEAPRIWMEAGLLGIALVWGLTFVFVKEGVTRIPVYSFNSVRFLLAAVVLGAFSIPRLRKLDPAGWRHGAVLGVFLFAGYAFQTVGLQYTEASRAGFITGMFVVFTPLLSAVLLRRPPSVPALAGVVLATVGLGLLSLQGTFVPAFGDVLILACAVAFAAHIVGLGAWSARHDPLPLTVVQLLTAGVLHTIVAGSIEVRATDYQWDLYVIFAILVGAFLASAAAFWIQTMAQRVVPPTRTAIILTMEPVFAGIFGYLLLGERLTGRGWLGSALILAGMLTAELWTVRREDAYAGASP